MNDQMQALARRAVACKHWQLMRGMTLLDGGLVTGERDGVPIVYARDGRHSADMLPDLTDPATLGCLLALVRQAWDDPSLCANDAGAYDLMFWHVYADDKFVSLGCQTEAEALIAALEAAP